MLEQVGVAPGADQVSGVISGREQKLVALPHQGRHLDPAELDRVLDADGRFGNVAEIARRDAAAAAVTRPQPRQPQAGQDVPVARVGPIEAARQLGEVDENQVPQLGRAGEVGGRLVLRPIRAPVEHAVVEGRVEDAELEGQGQGVPQEHPTHAVASPGRLEPALDTLASDAPLGLRRRSLAAAVVRAVGIGSTVVDHELVAVVAGREMQGARVPLGQQHEALDRAERPQTALPQAPPRGRARRLDLLLRLVRSTGSGSKLFLTPHDPLDHATEVVPQLLVDRVRPRPGAGSGEAHVARRDGEQRDRQDGLFGEQGAVRAGVLERRRRDGRQGRHVLVEATGAGAHQLPKATGLGLE